MPSFKFVYSQEHDLGSLKKDLYFSLKKNGGVIVSEAFEAGEINDLHSILQELFLRSDSKKMNYHRSGALAPGFSAYGNSKALDTGVPNLLETWDIPKQGDFTNWPDNMHDELLFLHSFEKKCFQISLKVLQIISFTLGLNENEQLHSLVSAKDGGLHLIHYFPYQRYSDRAARRQSWHTDMTLITLLPPSNIGGLFVKDSNQREEEVILDKTDCFIQVGKLLERITCGEFKANLHTVECSVKYKDRRFATPFFLSPSASTQLSVLSPFDNLPESIKYPTLTTKEIQHNYFKSIFGKQYE